MDFVDNKYEENNKVGKGGIGIEDNYNNSRGRNFIDESSKNRNRSKSPIINQGITNYNNKNFDGSKVNSDSSNTSKNDWMVDFSFKDNNPKNNNNYSGFQDHGFDFDFVTPNTTGTNKAPSTNKPISTKEIKDEFEDFIFTSSNLPTNSTKSDSAKTNNNNLLDFGNNNQNNNAFNQKGIDQYNPNPGYVYNNNNNLNANYGYNNNNYNNMYAYNMNTGYGNPQNAHKAYTMNPPFNNNVNASGYSNVQPVVNKSGNNFGNSNNVNNSNKNLQNVQLNNNPPNKRSNEQNIYDFFK
jgi:hypothetical protein